MEQIVSTPEGGKVSAPDAEDTWYYPQDQIMEPPGIKHNRITKEFEEFVSQVIFDQCAKDNARLEMDILTAISLQGWQRFNRLIIVEDKNGCRSVASLLTSIVI
jgi:hypothetical protein